MRSARFTSLSLAATVVLLVGGVSLAGCGDEVEAPIDSGDAPDNTGPGNTDGALLGTSLPPEMTAAPNPDAGGDGAPAPSGAGVPATSAP